MSTRKPHNHLAGYICELKSKHPKLPGHFGIFARDKGGDWATGVDGDRYAVVHLKPDGTLGGVVCLPNLPSAREVEGHSLGRQPRRPRATLRRIVLAS